MKRSEFVWWMAFVAVGVVVLCVRTAFAVTSSWLSADGASYNFALAWICAFAFGNVALKAVQARVERRRWEKQQQRRTHRNEVHV